MHRYRPHRAAFTLVELLVVITIIGVLIALLLPALSRTRDAAAGLQCLVNQRSVGIAASSYLIDGGGFIPRDYTPSVGNKVLVPEVLLGYLGGPTADQFQAASNDREIGAILLDYPVLQCPEFPEPYKPGDAMYSAAAHSPYNVTHPLTGQNVRVERQPYHFAVNAWAFKGDPGAGGRTFIGRTNIERIPSPSRYVYLTEASRSRPINQFDLHDIFVAKHLPDRPDQSLRLRRPADDGR